MSHGRLLLVLVWTPAGKEMFEQWIGPGSSIILIA